MLFQDMSSLKWHSRSRSYLFSILGLNSLLKTTFQQKKSFFKSKMTKK